MNPSTEKKIIDYVLAIISLFKVFISGGRSEKLPTKGYKDQLFILGNGPSLVDSINKNLDIIANSDLIAVNHLSRSDYFVKLKPSVLVLTPIEFWVHQHDTFLTSEFYRTADPIVENTDWDLTIVAPSTAKKCKEPIGYLKQNKRIKIVFVNMTPIDGNQKVANWIMKTGRGLPRPHNVLIPSLVIGINLDYKKILLVGADHSWLPSVRVTDKNEVVMVQSHFYDKEDRVEKAMYNANSKGFDRKLHEVLQKFTYAFKSYFVIESYAKSVGCRIINMTPNSFIDAFEREVE